MTQHRVQDVTFEIQPLEVNRPSEHRRMRKEALDKLDNAKFGCFHIRACVVSGIGFLTVTLQIMFNKFSRGCVIYHTFFKGCL
jgi:hypothetical protein